MSRSMWLSQRTAALLVAARFVFSTGLAHSDDKVSPELEPKSDKKFFDKDYPNDKRAVVDKHYIFDHPYPAVQDSGDFDRDFVKDENADGGRWQAQMQYDTLRSKIRTAEKDLIEAKSKLDKETREWQEAKDRLSDSRDDQEAAEKDRRKAEKAAGEAQAEVNELEGGSQKHGTQVGGAVNDAVKKVNDEMSDLEECKKQLQEAKERLKDLMKEKEEHKKAKEEAAKDAKEAAKDAKEAKEKEEAARKKKEEEHQKMRKREMDEEEKIREDEKALAEDEVAQRTVEEAGWKKKLTEEQSEHAQATKTYEQELADVKRTERQLKQAEANLRKFRRPPYVDNGGGVYNVPDEKSGAAQPFAHTVALLLLALGATAIR